MANDTTIKQIEWIEKYANEFHIDSAYGKLLTKNGKNEMPKYLKVKRKFGNGDIKVLDKAYKVEKINDKTYRTIPSRECMELIYPHLKI